ncbi:cobalt transporter CbiM [Humidesulfovibrio sp.]
MHISEGVLSLPILATGAALAAAGVFIGLKKIENDRLVSVAILSAAFFVGSLIHIPIGPASAHLILNGLLGAVLGWASFPAILVGLLLQAVLFQYGGLTVLGVNTFDMAAPAVLCSLLCGPLLRRTGKARAIGAFLCGSLSVLLAALFTATALALTDEGFVQAAATLVLAHVPVMLLEGGFTVLVVGYLSKAMPEIFQARLTA